MAMTAQDWSISGLATELGLSRRRVAKAVEQVAPTVRSARNKRYRMRDVVQAIYSGGSDSGGPNQKLNLDEQTARLKKFQADKAELELAEKAGLLVDIELTTKGWAEFAGNCRGHLLNLPSKAAPQVVGLSVPEAEKLLEGFVFEALEEIAANGDKNKKRLKKNSSHSGGNVLPDGSASKAKGKRVGRQRKKTVK